MGGAGADQPFDTAVIGGGLSGCYCACRLASSARAGRVALVEAEAACGGRLRSGALCDRTVEYGAMRFPADEPRLNALFRELDLDRHIVDFPGEQPRNLFYGRGLRVPRARIAGTAPPYPLRPEERSKSPQQLLGAVVEAALPGFWTRRAAYNLRLGSNDDESADEILRAHRAALESARSGSDRLVDTSWRAFLARSLSEGAMRLLEDFDGYESRASNGSAAHWLDNVFLAPDRSAARTLSVGLNAICRKLTDRFEAQGGVLRRNHPATRIGKRGDDYVVICETAGGPRELRAHTVILAAPMAAVAAIALPFAPDEPFRRATRAALPVDAFKLFLTYPEPWWIEKGLTSGRRTTDLPIRQVYYDPARARPAVIMAAYCSGADVGYWRALADGAKAGAMDRIAAAAHAQIVELHGDGRIPPPVDAHAQFWLAAGRAPGWHVWKAGADRMAAIRAAARLRAGERVFLIGEAWSTEPGSMQGALESADRVLERWFHIPGGPRL